MLFGGQPGDLELSHGSHEAAEEHATMGLGELLEEVNLARAVPCF